MNRTLVLLLLLLLGSLPCSAGARAAESPLADAAERADFREVRRLLDSGADPRAAQVDGTTALHWAAWHDRTDAARRLLQAGADAEAKNRYGVTPLTLACVNGNADLTSELLRRGADPNTTLPGGQTALMTAARTGRIEVVRALIKREARVNDRERGGQTALMWAAAEGHAAVVELLLESGADASVSLPSGFNAFLFAVREGQTAVVDVLLQRGADVNQAMRPERSGGRLPRTGTSPLLLAVENGHFALARRLLQAGADPNDQQSGYTPLHAISWVRKPNLGDGLDGTPPPRGSGDVTSLQFVRLLVEHGADVNARLRKGRSGRGRLNQQGATPFLFAADTADVPLMKVLLELGADPTIPNADNCPPLLAAAGLGTLAPGEEAGTEEEALAAVRLLLEGGADVNAVDDNGETAMHGAAYKSLPRMVELLASRGADVRVWNRKNKYGWTPLLIAEGYRPGNFKPAPATIQAVRRAMLDAGVEPPERVEPPGDQGNEYAKPRYAKPAADTPPDAKQKAEQPNRDQKTKQP